MAATTSKHTPIRWTEAEKDQVKGEGIRLARAHPGTSYADLVDLAQKTLPKHRRRTISSPWGIPWFIDAVRPARGLGPESTQQNVAASTPAPVAVESQKSARIVWTVPEKLALVDYAAAQLSDLNANSPTDALRKAQIALLPAERQRDIQTAGLVADWYPTMLKAAIERLKAEREAAAAAAAVAAAAAATPPAPPPPEPAAPTPPLLDQIRTLLVEQVAAIVAEGIRLGIELAQQAPRETGAPMTPKVRQLAVATPKKRGPSVLVVGLRGGQAPQIEAEFGDRLDLRFCEADKSKDQLRAMANQAETTVAFVDFLSHSHTDICKANARHYVETHGGMTRLRQQLAQLAGIQANGHAAAA